MESDPWGKRDPDANAEDDEYVHEIDSVDDLDQLMKSIQSAGRSLD